MGEKVDPEGDYFACIVKAYEVLGTTAKRRSYDSIDPEFDDYIPPKNVSSPSMFFKVLALENGLTRVGQTIQ